MGGMAGWDAPVHSLRGMDAPLFAGLPYLTAARLTAHIFFYRSVWYRSKRRCAGRAAEQSVRSWLDL